MDFINRVLVSSAADLTACVSSESGYDNSNVCFVTSTSSSSSSSEEQEMEGERGIESHARGGGGEERG